MAIDIAGANTYFSVTADIRSEAWTRITQARRIAAIAHATRVIQACFDDPDDLETDATIAGDFPRHDAAVYEQAFWMLQEYDFIAQDRAERSARIAKGQWTTKSAPPNLNLIAYEARVYIELYPRRVTMGRG